MKPQAMLLFSILSIAIAGCTERQVYDAMQKRGQVECQNLLQAQYEECIKDYQESYDAYNRALDEARDKN